MNYHYDQWGSRASGDEPQWGFSGICPGVGVPRASGDEPAWGDDDIAEVVVFPARVGMNRHSLPSK